METIYINTVGKIRAAESDYNSFTYVTSSDYYFMLLFNRSSFPSLVRVIADLRSPKVSLWELLIRTFCRPFYIALPLLFTLSPYTTVSEVRTLKKLIIATESPRMNQNFSYVCFVYYHAPILSGTGYCFRSISLFCLFVSLFLCQQDYEETAGPICMKFSGKAWSDLGTTWLHFWSAPRNRAMPRCATRGRGLLCFSTTACFMFVRCSAERE